MADCTGRNAAGQPCSNPVVGDDGVCVSHRRGGTEHMRAIGAKGGQALKAAWSTPGFAEGEVALVKSVDEAKEALANVHVAVLTRRITKDEANAASKALSEWVKADTAAITKHLVGALRGELDAKAVEIEQLRKELAKPAHLRIAK